VTGHTLRDRAIPHRPTSLARHPPVAETVPPLPRRPQLHPNLDPWHHCRHLMLINLLVQQRYPVAASHRLLHPRPPPPVFITAAQVQICRPPESKSTPSTASGHPAGIACSPSCMQESFQRKNQPGIMRGGK
jgi:hypothetical protein